ncbi:hypothetical protein ABVF67_003562 [Vibrio parahaemolyticus]|uniref:hypothetical protein n=1 Tax=Vibrio parahaemolyticus TaxID=670 RepID=UPI000408BFDE|nr:hypothetical protein [Vibrio parahaemolyticus]EGR1569475.1 hypothetical protein [Vibrio parahaemolyticus]EIE7520140.1 hypothetical protein [Vibrio parahaemolyticus]EJC7970269.1 hypothetical protein [Vibrio parahaemolyticus]MDF4338806.1 hypothetical protein [Vibrio parahaemolyticus]MDF4930914.1 hypothetical protein [Vibrio parahaemolyticus]
MEFSVISEDFMRSSSTFQSVDDREFLYSTNNFHPTSSENPIRWEDKNITSSMVHPISDNGDICVSKELAELVMSFDPYGVEFYPASLLTKDGEITERYILALNNIQDVVDFERSVIEVSPNSGNLIVHRLFLSPEKILNIPFHKRVVYRAEGADTAVFFAPEIYDLISNDSRFSLVRKMKKNTSTRAPKF